MSELYTSHRERATERERERERENERERVNVAAVRVMERVQIVRQ